MILSDPLLSLCIFSYDFILAALVTVCKEAFLIGQY